jgi:hypothetical protein
MRVGQLDPTQPSLARRSSKFAQELFRVAGKDGKIVHGEIAICRLWS